MEKAKEKYPSFENYEEKRLLLWQDKDKEYLELLKTEQHIKTQK